MNETETMQQQSVVTQCVEKTCCKPRVMASQFRIRSSGGLELRGLSLRLRMRAYAVKPVTEMAGLREDEDEDDPVIREVQ